MEKSTDYVRKKKRKERLDNSNEMAVIKQRCLGEIVTKNKQTLNSSATRTKIPYNSDKISPKIFYFLLLAAK